MNKTNRISENELKNSLRLVTIAASIGLPFFTITGGPALTGLTTSLGTSDIIYSVIMAMPVIGAIIQVFASYYMENTGRRKLLFILSGFIHRPFWIFIAFVPFLINQQHNELRILIITVLIAISSAANSIAGISFNSWMGALVPAEIKGRFFGKRAMYYTITGLITALVTGKFLDLVPGFPGYAAVFTAAAILGAADIFMFFWVKDPPMEPPKKKIPFHKLFVIPFRDKNYVRYIIFISLWYFSVNFAGPFFNRYMLEELHLTFFIMIAFTQVTSSFSMILFIRFWGKLADRYGSKPVMAICGWFVFIFPFVWLFVTPSSAWLILLINFLGGIFWPGFELTAMNQSIWLTPEKNRSIYIANYTLIVSLVGTALAFLCGGAFMELCKIAISKVNIPFLMGQTLSSYHILFAVSGILRLLVLIFISRTYDEADSESTGNVLKNLRTAIKNRLKISS